MKVSKDESRCLKIGGEAQGLDLVRRNFIQSWLSHLEEVDCQEVGHRSMS